ncbi:MAG: hypothetical protein ACFB10_24365 [Salibacteraceae bacterium]
MRYLIVFLLLHLFSGDIYSQSARPSTVNSLSEINARIEPIAEPAEELKGAAHYQGQKYWWAQKVRLEPTNTKAWYNYFQATRLAGFNPQSKPVYPSTQQELQQLLQEMERKCGTQNFEFQYLTYLQESDPPAQYQHLQFAFQLDPNRTETYDDLAAFAEKNGNREERLMVLTRMHRQSVYSAGILQYNRNVLASVDSNGIVFTNGNYDTFPLWLLQEIDGVRPDVRVLNLDLLADEAYRRKQYDALGITEVQTGHPVTDKANYFAALVVANPQVPLHFGLTLDRGAIRELKPQLYLTGLVLRYSPKGFNNLDLLQRRWEQSFDRERLTAQAANLTEQNLKKNYAVMLAVLCRHYHELGNTSATESTREIALKLAGDPSRQVRLQTYFEQNLR